MNLQEIRRKRGVEQADLAAKIGTNAPMMSNFEHYKCLPIPSMLVAICKELNCSVLDLYDASELYIQEKNTTKKSIKAKEDNVNGVYRLTADLPNYAREILSSKNLDKCGYHSLKDFIYHCFKWFEKRLKAIDKEKATKQCRCSEAHEIGNTTNLSHQ